MLVYIHTHTHTHTHLSRLYSRSLSLSLSLCPSTKPETETKTGQQNVCVKMEHTMTTTTTTNKRCDGGLDHDMEKTAARREEKKRRKREKKQKERIARMLAKLDTVHPPEPQQSSMAAKPVNDHNPTSTNHSNDSVGKGGDERKQKDQDNEDDHHRRGGASVKTVKKQQNQTRQQSDGSSELFKIDIDDDDPIGKEIAPFHEPIVTTVLPPESRKSADKSRPKQKETQKQPRLGKQHPKEHQQRYLPGDGRRVRSMPFISEYVMNHFGRSEGNLRTKSGMGRNESHAKTQSTPTIPRPMDSPKAAEDPGKAQESPVLRKFVPFRRRSLQGAGTVLQKMQSLLHIPGKEWPGRPVSSSYFVAVILLVPSVHASFCHASLWESICHTNRHYLP